MDTPSDVSAAGVDAVDDALRDRRWLDVSIEEISSVIAPADQTDDPPSGPVDLIVSRYEVCLSLLPCVLGKPPFRVFQPEFSGHASPLDKRKDVDGVYDLNRDDPVRYA